jgi:hypothetical protein
MSTFWLWLRERRRTMPGADHVAEVLREENARFQAEIEARLAELMLPAVKHAPGQRWSEIVNIKYTSSN